MPNPYDGGWGAAPPAAPYRPDPYSPDQYPPYGSFDPFGSLRRSEYAQLRKHGNGVGVCILSYFALQYILADALHFLLEILGLTGVYPENVGFTQAVNAVLFNMLSLFLPFLVLSLRRGSPSYIKVLPLSSSKNRLTAFFVVLAGFGFCMASNFVTHYVSSFIQNTGLEEVDTSSAASVGVIEVLINLLCTAAIPALVEEFAFRGVILQPLRRYGEHFAVLSTALVFGLAHGTVSNFVFAFLVGVALGYAAVITGSIWPGVIIHFLNNFYAAAITDLYSANPKLANTAYGIIVYAGLVLGVGALTYLILTHAFRFKKGRAESLLTGIRCRGFFLSVPMAISIGAFLFFIVVVNLSITGLG